MDNSVSQQRLLQLHTWKLPDASQPVEERMKIADVRRAAAAELHQVSYRVAFSMKAGNRGLDGEWRSIANHASKLEWNDAQSPVAAPVLQLLTPDPDFVSDSQKKAFLNMVDQLPPYPQV